MRKLAEKAFFGFLTVFGLLLVSLIVPKTVNAQVFVNHIDSIFKNGGNSPSTVNLRIWDRFGNWVVGGPSSWDSISVGPFGSYRYSAVDVSGNNGPYSVQWDPWKSYLADARDVTCQDPITETSLASFTDVGTVEIVWMANMNYQCWIPDQPPPPPQAPVQPARNNPPTQACGTNTTPDATFSWGTSVGATQYRVRIWDGNDWDLASPWQTGNSYPWTDIAASNTGVNWTVTASNGAGESGITQGNWDEFQTIGCTAPPAPANLTVSKPLCSDTNYSADFNWDDVTGATSFTHRLNGVDTNVNTSARSVSGIVPGAANNTWSVRSNNAIGSSAFTNGPGFSVPTCTRPDLRVVSLNCPGYAEPNTTFSCDGQIRNEDSASTGTTFIHVFLRGSGENPSTWSSIGSGTHEILAGNTTGTTKISLSQSLAAGVYKVRMCADQPNNIVDSGVIEEGTNPSSQSTPEEQNNCSDVRIFVTAKPNPPCTAVNAYGDVTGDGKVWGNDATEILKYVAGIPTTYIDTAAEIEKADVDNNGVITSVDALKVLRFIEGLETTFAACTPVDPTNPGFSVVCVSGLPQVTFRWTDNSDNESEFTLTVSGQGKSIAASSGTGSTVTYLWKTGAPVGTLTPANNTSYWWNVAARNSAFISSSVSTDPATFTTPDCRVPTTPGSLTATASCGNGLSAVNLSWTDSSYELGYIVEIGTTSAFTTKGTKSLGADSSGWTWSSGSAVDSGDTASLAGIQTTPLDSRSYYIRIKAYNTLNESSWANASPFPVSTADCRAPNTPTVLDATSSCSAGSVSILFSWTKPTNPTATGYYLEINQNSWDSSYGFVVLGDVSSYNWLAGTDLFNGPPDSPTETGPFYWRMKSYNNGGESAYTAVQTVTTCPDLTITAFSVPDGNVGATVNASVTIKNNGGQSASNFQVAVNNNGSIISCTDGKIVTASVASLAAGSQSVLSIPFTVPSPPGTYNAISMVDSNCQVIEASEVNNISAVDTYLSQGFDLSVTVVSLDKPSYNDGETAKFKVDVTNNGNISSPASGVKLGIWPKGGLPKDNTAYPSCSASPSTAPTDPGGKVQSYSLGALNVGQTLTLDGTVNSNYSFNVGSAPDNFLMKAYVVYDCAVADSYWPNNGSDCLSPCTNRNQSYSVVVPSFFEGSGGDVGSQAGISISRTPQPGISKQSNYIAAAPSLSNVQSTWKISNYNQRQVPTIVYPYLKEKFYNTAKTQTSVCNFGIHRVGATTELSANYCSGLATFGAGSFLPNGVAYWFIDGSLNIDSNIIISTNPASSALVLVVRDNVTVKTGVNRVDAIIVAGNTFYAQTSATDRVGAQLTINGAVYTNQSDLSRILGGGAGVCGLICDNAQDPAIVFKLDPKYLVLLSSRIGTPSLSWKEVAP